MKCALRRFAASRRCTRLARLAVLAAIYAVGGVPYTIVTALLGTCLAILERQSDNKQEH